MSSPAENLPNLERDLPITPEDSKWLQYLSDNPPHLTWDEYVKAVDEFSRQRPPNRDVHAWDEPFEI